MDLINENACATSLPSPLTPSPPLSILPFSLSLSLFVEQTKRKEERIIPLACDL